VSGRSLLYLLSHPRLAARRVGGRLGLRDRVTDLAEEADRLERALQDVNSELLTLGEGSPTGRPYVLLDYPATQIRISARVPKRSDATAKEPFTVAWLERELRADDVLYDVGANIGAYALIAACSTPTVRVVAFEPAAETFAVLCENIVLNEVAHRITPVPIVLGSETKLGVFRYRDLRPGAAQHDSLGTTTDDAFAYDQPVLQFGLDDLVREFALPPATLVKLDVDGAEAAVLAGARNTLRSPHLRSLMVEMPTGEAGVRRALEEAGFRQAETHETRDVEYGLFARAT
jgi:FkbM family methyltransferase